MRLVAWSRLQNSQFASESWNSCHINTTLPYETSVFTCLFRLVHSVFEEWQRNCSLRGSRRRRKWIWVWIRGIRCLGYKIQGTKILRVYAKAIDIWRDHIDFDHRIFWVLNCWIPLNEMAIRYEEWGNFWWNFCNIWTHSSSNCNASSLLLHAYKGQISIFRDEILRKMVQIVWWTPNKIKMELFILSIFH